MEASIVYCREPENKKK